MPAFRQIAPPLEVKPKRKKPTTAYSQDDLFWAKSFHEIVKDQLKEVGRWSRSSWANEFRLLRTQLGQDGKRRINMVLEWIVLTRCFREQKILRIRSAASFRRHFDYMEEQFKKDSGNQVAEITPEAKTLAKELRRMSWPNGSDELLEQTIQLTFDRYTKALQIVLTMYQSRKRAYEQLPSPKRTDRYLLLLEHLYRSRLSSPGHFTQRWMEDIHKQVESWAGWNGDLIAMAFKFDCPRFQRMLRGWTDEFGSETATWYTFWKEFCDASGTATNFDCELMGSPR